MEGIKKFEMSKEIKESLWYIWDLINSIDKMRVIFNKVFEEEIILKVESIYTKNELKKISWLIPSFSLIFRFFLIPNTLENTKLLTIKILETKPNDKNYNYEKICNQIFYEINSDLLTKTPHLKTYESIIINVNIERVWSYMINWECLYTMEGVYSPIQFKGDPKKVGSEIFFLYNNNSKNVGKVNEVYESNDEKILKFCLSGDESETEDFIVIVKAISDKQSFMSVENDVNFSMQIENQDMLGKNKPTFLKTIKTYLEQGN